MTNIPNGDDRAQRLVHAWFYGDDADFEKR